MELGAKLKQIKGLNVLFELLEQINIERLKTLYGALDNVEALIIFKDKRKLSDKQRKLYRALLNDIYKWSGQGTQELHEIFKEDFFCSFGERISTANDSRNSKTDMNKLIESVISFMFEWNVPFAKGYELLPRDEQFYLYQCCKHRKCAVCGKHAEIHHIDTVGAGNNRKRVDHTKKQVISVCRHHHAEAHTIGNEQFLAKYKLNGIYLSYQDFNDLGLMSQKLIDELEHKGE